MALTPLRYPRRRCQICRRLPMRYHQQHLWGFGSIRVLHAEDVNEARCGVCAFLIAYIHPECWSWPGSRQGVDRRRSQISLLCDEQVEGALWGQPSLGGR
jgi:hypothetical protein